MCNLKEKKKKMVKQMKKWKKLDGKKNGWIIPADTLCIFCSIQNYNMRNKKKKNA